MASTNIYPEFKPTYLYIKQHSVTGMLYFGKTVQNPEKYLGSGTYWNSHISKHGKEHVVTLWYCLFFEKDSIVEFALSFSNQHNITESELWANLKPENGLDGVSMPGKLNPNYGNYWADDQKNHMSVLAKARGLWKGELNPSSSTDRKEKRRLDNIENNPMKNKCWVKIGDVEKTIQKEELDNFISTGWEKGRVISIDQRKKLSESRKGKSPWNKGLKTQSKDSQ